MKCSRGRGEAWTRCGVDPETRMGLRRLAWSTVAREWRMTAGMTPAMAASEEMMQVERPTIGQKRAGCGCRAERGCTSGRAAERKKKVDKVFVSTSFLSRDKRCHV